MKLIGFSAHPGSVIYGSGIEIGTADKAGVRRKFLFNCDRTGICIILHAYTYAKPWGEGRGGDAMGIGSLASQVAGACR